ncbi:hypothetical protein DXG01_009787 [Tephrocybe rancida]|nr:hypothetical protein DXG01_009787 [Tephrocybe rancida]
MALKLIFEDALMNLVEQVQGKAVEDVTVGKVMPEGLVNGMYSILLEFWRFLTTAMLV